MNDDIARLLRRFDSLTEGVLTPTSPRRGLNRQQKSVPQLPALFRPKKISVLQNPQDPQHPMKGYAVGTSESRAMAQEDALRGANKQLGDYLQDVASAVKKDPDLVDKIKQVPDGLGPAVKTISTPDGHTINIHGNKDDGFRISVRNRAMRYTFEALEHAVMACEMYCQRRDQSPGTQDYVEEA